MVDLTPAAQRLADLVARVGDDELGRPTPCPAYTLADLGSTWGLALAFRAAAEKDTASPPDVAHDFLAMLASPDAPAGPEVAFGPSREVPGDAPALDRVVALAGRDPAWAAG